MRSFLEVALWGGAAVCAGFLLTGCGAGGSSATSTTGGEAASASSTASGRAALSVRWPERGNTRLVPFAANSIRVRLFSPDGSRQFGEALLVRPANGGVATASFANLPTGPLRFSAAAYPSADGSGVSQAGADTQAVVLAGQNIDLRLTLASTIDRLEVSSSPLNVPTGERRALFVQAKNAPGEVVVTAPSSFAWTSSNTGVASVEGGEVRGVASGAATITVRDTESGKSASVPVAVTTPGPQFVYRNDFQGIVGPEWNWQTVRTDPINPSDRLLGDIKNNTIRLSLANLPAHGSVTVAFDLYVLNSWDGNGAPPIGSEIWSLKVAGGGPTLLYTNFNNNAGNQAYPGTFPTDSYPARTGAAVSSVDPRYTVYRISKTFAHNGGSVGLEFAGAGLEEAAENEGWAIDDIEVSVSP